MAPKRNNGRNKKAKKALKKQQEPKNVESTTEVSTEPTVEATTEVVSQVTDASSAQLSGGGVAKKSKATKVSKAKTTTNTVNESEVQTELATITETATETTTQTGGGKQVRSFKVQLPGSETFEGRFTGLTPYQAANKALSKYYRENKKPKKQIRFTIRESTRGSKRGLYTYNGQREKLKTPVEYSIKDGRVITKKYKNKLVKVKKAELENLTV